MTKANQFFLLEKIRFKLWYFPVENFKFIIFRIFLLCKINNTAISHPKVILPKALRHAHLTTTRRCKRVCSQVRP